MTRDFKTWIRVGWITDPLLDDRDAILLGIVFGFLMTKNIHSVTRWICSSLIPAFVAPNVLKWHWWRFNGYGFFAGMVAGTAPSFQVDLVHPVRERNHSSLPGQFP